MRVKHLTHTSTNPKNTQPSLISPLLSAPSKSFLRASKKENQTKEKLFFSSLHKQLSMASSTKKKLLQTVAVDLGCSCGRPKLSILFWPKSKPNKNKFLQKPNKKFYQSSSSSLEASGLTSIEEDEDDSNSTNTSFSPKFDSTSLFSESEDPTNSTKSINGYSRIGESIAVVKDSNDPYVDFRNSMLQMIWEKEIYAREDLRELLDCFLSLNSPYHHEIILRVFREICNGVFTSSSVTKMNHHQHQGYSWKSKKGNT